jgi:hypothetical protein
MIGQKESAQLTQLRARTANIALGWKHYNVGFISPTVVIVSVVPSGLMEM